MAKKNEMSLNIKDIHIRYCKNMEVIPLIKHLHYGIQNLLVYFNVCEPPYVYAPPILFFFYLGFLSQTFMNESQIYGGRGRAFL